jgi:hypothetical protein|tara:strand:+ start:221 stop:3445 length:3225 start_codon:yes stop_codon:yes gene_type:complete
MSLFQSIVIEKYVRELDSSQLETAWQTFSHCFLNLSKQDNIRLSKEEQYQEGFLRDLFVDVFGYTLNPNPNYNLTTEFKNQTGSKKADGAILKDGHAIGVIELKGMNTTDLSKIEQQAFGYKNNQTKCRYVITSNFQKLRLYIDNAVEFIEFNLFTLTKEDFALLYLLLHRDGLMDDLPAKIKSASLSQEEAITKQLYKDYSVFKRELFNDLTTHNPSVDNLVLFQKSQKLLDRLLFIFFAEDSHLLPANFAKGIINEWEQLKSLKMTVPLYDRVKAYFGYLDTGHKDEHSEIFAYNGGLFSPDELLDSVIISDDILHTHIKILSEYDFDSEVDVNILGHIFENSLSELDEVKAQLEGTAVDKSQTKRKKDGVFYTPKYITKYIVENTVGKLCEDKKAALEINDEDYQQDISINKSGKKRKKTDKRIEEEKKALDRLHAYRDWLLQITICDPAVGSGAFLNEALNFLIAEHEYVVELETKLFGSGLAYPDIENSILENNLFGVDINEESVEIAKLSLWLRTAQPRRKLNNLNDNIQCGNSLIDDPAIAGDKAFNWQMAFPQVFEKGGFDVVIGNPPYVKEYTSKNSFNGLRSKEVYQGKMDLWYFFGDLALDIVKKEKGLIGIIAPNNWITNAGGSNFRNAILDKAKIYDFIDFGDYKVFEDAGIQTMIYIMSNSDHNDAYELNYSRLNNKKPDYDLVAAFLAKINNECTYFKSEINKKRSRGKLLHFINSQNNEVLKKINRLQDFKLNKDEVAQGIVAPQDFLNDKNSMILGEGFEAGQGIFNLTSLEVEKMDLDTNDLKLIKPFYTSDKLKKYYGIPHNDFWVIYTDSFYKKQNSLDNFPKIKAHLDQFQKIITSHNKPYGLHRARDENFFTGEKILSLRKCIEPTFTYTDFDCYVSQTYFSIKTDRLNLKFLTALLNSSLMRFWLKYKGKMQGDIFQVDKEPLLGMPIKISNNIDDFSEKLSLILSLNQELQELKNKFLRTLDRKFNDYYINKRLESWHDLTYADFIKELAKKKIKMSLGDEAEWEEYFLAEQTKAKQLVAEIESTDREIDQMVYKLYDLTDDEIAIIEAS